MTRKRNGGKLSQGRFAIGNPGGPGRPKGLPNKATREHKAFFRGILESDAYRAAFTKRVIHGDPALEQMMHYYVLGKPKDTVSIEQAPPLLVIDELSEADIAIIHARRDDA